jgi:hypothetical protein
MSFMLGVEYPAELYFSNPDIDADIREAVNVQEDGSGMGFGFRDLSFTFNTEEEAQAAGIRAAQTHPSVTYYVNEMEDEYAYCNF